MKRDMALQHLVQAALSAEPGINRANIGVVLHADQRISLTGTVTCESARHAALAACRAVPSVSAVHDALVVHPLEPTRERGTATQYSAPQQAPIALDAVVHETDKCRSLLSTFRAGRSDCPLSETKRDEPAGLTGLS